MKLLFFLSFVLLVNTLPLSDTDNIIKAKPLSASFANSQQFVTNTTLSTETKETKVWQQSGSARISLPLIFNNFDPSQPARLYGRILDANAAEQGTTIPLVAATVTNLETGLTTLTDSQGYFALEGLTPGENHFDFDGSTAIPTNTYGGYRAKITVLKHQTVTIERPIYLMKIDPDSLTDVNPNNTTMLINPNLDITLELPPNTVIDDNGFVYDGMMSLSPVPSRFTPASLPDTLEPGLVVTIQPMGLTFDQPAPITFANTTDNLMPNSEVDIWSLDHDTGEFFVAGKGRVSEDGQWIETIEGGVQEASWHFALPPDPNSDKDTPDKEAGNNEEDDCPYSSTIGVRGGCLKTTINLPTYFSLGQEQAVNLVYTSQTAYPIKLIPTEVTIQRRSAVPNTVSYETTLNGIQQDEERFVDVTTFDENQDETLRISLPLDASHLPTAVYPYSVRLKSNFDTSTVASLTTDETMVINQKSSPFGAGWGLAGLQRLYPQPNNAILITDGDGTGHLFKRPFDDIFTSASTIPLEPNEPFDGTKGMIDGDFNEDGILDLVVSYQQGFNIALLFGDGKGGFSTPTEIAVGLDPQYFATGDFDEDDNLDLMVAKWGDNDVTLLLGDGNGNFTQLIDISVGINPQFITTGDFNTDDNLDFAVTNVNSDNLSLLFGDGNANFSPPTNIPTGNAPRDILSADFDNNNTLDLAVVNEFGNNITIYLGDGNGTFAPPTNVAVGARPWEVDSGDFNGDGNLDLAITNFFGHTVSILLGNGLGSFSAATNFPTGISPFGLTTIDINEDGRLDIVTANGTTDDISILLGNGNGTFAPPVNYMVGDGPSDIAIGNFDEDIFLDLAIANYFDNTISILQGNSDGTLVAPNSYTVEATPVFATTADFDGNGHLDLVSTNFDSDNISLLLGQSDGTFQPRTNFIVGDGPKFGAAGDFNGDNNQDLAIINVNSNDLSILLGDGNGDFAPPTTIAVGTNPDSIATADLNKDGVLDLTVSNMGDNTIAILTGNGDGTFTLLHNINVGIGPEFIAIADFNEDTNLDLAVTARNNDLVSILLGNGSGNFPINNTFPAGNSPDNIAIADFDDNGTIDLAITNEEDDTISILFGDGNGNFNTPTAFGVGDAPEAIEAADLNGDGLTDLIVTNAASDNISLLFNNGSGVFTAPLNFKAGDEPLFVLIEDFDQDNKLDLAVVNASSGTISVLSGKANATGFQSPVGDFSTLVTHENDTYTRTYQDGTIVHFNSNGRQTAITDRYNNEITYQYDAQGRLLTIVDAVGKITTFTYQNGLLATITDPTNRITHFDHNSNGDLIGVTLPNNAERTFQYDNNHLMIGETDENGGQITRVYNRVGRIVSAELADGSTRESSPSQLIGWIDPASGTGTQSNPAPLTRPNQATTILTDGQGRSTQRIIGPLGRPTQITDPAGFDTIIARDEDGNALRTTLASGAIYNRTFDENGNMLSYTDETIAGTTTFTYEPHFNQITSFTDPFTQTTTFTYDAFGNMTSITTPLNRTATFAYDTRGLVTSMVDNVGTTTTYTYDAHGNLTTLTQGSSPTQRNASMSYTSEGYLDTLTDPIGRTFDFNYDEFGHLSQESLPGNRTISYIYDDAGNLISLTPPSQPAHTFAYNDVNLMTTYTAPPVTGGGTNRTEYDYNLAQQLTQITRPDSLTLNYLYDNAGRLTTVTIPNGSYNYLYDGTTGQLNALTAPDGGTLQYDYDGELLTQVTWSGDINGNVAYEYDTGARLDRIMVNGTGYDFGYDADGLLTQAGTLTLNYDAISGLITASTLGNITDSWAFNQFMELDDYSAAYNSSNLFETAYTHDDLGRITQKVETVNSTTTTYDYTYDIAGRLWQVHQDSLLQATYTYDDNGNRLGDGTNTGSYDAQDRLLTYGSNSYTYTANGERLTKTQAGQTTQYTYDVVGNLLNVTLPNSTNITYVIDAADRRVGKKVNGTLVQGWLYGDDLNPVAELDGSGIVVSHFIYANRSNVPDYMVKSGITYRIISDHLGSVRLVVDTNTGTVVQRLNYDAWGVVIEDTNPGFQPFGFAGGLYDTDTALVRFGARDYDAEIGRWTSKDSLQFMGGTNFYQYVYNSPINYFDKTGHIPLLAIAPLIGGVINAGFELHNAVQSGCGALSTIRRTAAGFAGGVLGTTLGLGVGTINPLAGGAAGNAATTYITQSLQGRGVSNSELLVAGLTGLPGGFIGGKIFNSAQSYINKKIVVNNLVARTATNRAEFISANRSSLFYRSIQSHGIPDLAGFSASSTANIITHSTSPTNCECQ